MIPINPNPSKAIKGAQKPQITQQKDPIIKKNQLITW
jgi:hypothetical protein